MPTKPAGQEVRADALDSSPVAIDDTDEPSEFGDDLADLLSEALAGAGKAKKAAAEEKEAAGEEPEASPSDSETSPSDSETSSSDSEPSPSDGAALEEADDEGPEIEIGDDFEEFDLDMEIDQALAELPESFLVGDDDEDASDEDEEVSDDNDDELSLAELSQAVESAIAEEADGDDKDDTEDFDIDAAAEIDKMLSSSFALDGDLSDENPDLAFPDFGEGDGDGDGDDADDFSFLGSRWGGEDEAIDEPEAAPVEAKGPKKSKKTKKKAAPSPAKAPEPEALPDRRDEEIQHLRGQIAALHRQLKDQDLELRTGAERLELLQAQVVQSARQSANIGREFDALRRRSERDREDQQKFAGEKILKEFLSVLDNLERAMAHAGNELDTPLGQGVSMTLDQFIAALNRSGGERILPEPGDLFDPTFHEAVGQEHHPSVEQGQIVNRLQTGLSLHGRLLRAAMVSVSLGPSDEDSKTTKKTTRKKAAKKEAKGDEAKAELAPDAAEETAEAVESSPADNQLESESAEPSHAGADKRSTKRSSSKGKGSKKKSKKKRKK